MSRTQKGQVIERRGKRGRVFAIRFYAYGQRRYETLGTVEDGWNQTKAEEHLKDVLAAVRLNTWQPPDLTPLIEEPRPEPTFQVFASDWIAARRLELRPRSVEALQWALVGHLLPAFGRLMLSEITIERVDRYKTSKVRDREERRVERALSNGSINKTVAVLAQVLDEAVEYEYIDRNPARGRRRRLKAEAPRRTWLELDELRAILVAAGQNRALLATMVLAGLRVGELVRLRWRDVDLARGRLSVRESKTDAGVRVVDLSPDLLDELKTHRFEAGASGPDDLVFPSRNGMIRDRHNVRVRVLGKAVERANRARATAGLAPIQDGITNHTLRRTYASLLYEAGASPAYVMGQMGHRSSKMALEVYAKLMSRERDTGARMDALLRGADWALAGTTDALPGDRVTTADIADTPETA